MILDYLKTQIEDYNIKKISENEYVELHALHKTNSEYYSYIQDHEVTLDESIEDTVALPPNIGSDSKFYIGFYNNDKLEAIMDYIEGYPSGKIIWIGLFMVDGNLKRRGIGRNIMSGFLGSISDSDFKSVQLGVIEANFKAKQFWESFGFNEIRRSAISHEDGSSINIMVMEKSL